jgi:protein arginine kinase
MGIEILLKRDAEWLKGEGPDARIVVSSRVRFARNLRGITFPGRANAEARIGVRDSVQRALEGIRLMQGSLTVRLDEISELDRQFLVERHLSSREHARGDEGSALVVGDQEIMSIMVNEEDHLRIQALRSGFQLGKAIKEISELDDELEKQLEYAFLPTVGYLTSCPTNVGTGLRASVMLHLPGLVIANQINQVLQAVAKLGLAVRGLYGEGTEASGNLFQISNQVTLGKSEEGIVEEIEKVIAQIVEHEKKAQKALFTRGLKALEDRVYRAYGLLSGARIITSKETIELLSALKLGLDSRLIDLDLGTINELFIVTQPAHLQKLAGRELKPGERDVFRAGLIRSRLADGRKNPESRIQNSNEE